jgi:hypothetical protein
LLLVAGFADAAGDVLVHLAALLSVTLGLLLPQSPLLRQSSVRLGGVLGSLVQDRP